MLSKVEFATVRDTCCRDRRLATSVSSLTASPSGRQVGRVVGIAHPACKGAGGIFVPVVPSPVGWLTSSLTRPAPPSTVLVLAFPPARRKCGPAWVTGGPVAPWSRGCDIGRRAEVVDGQQFAKRAMDPPDPGLSTPMPAGHVSTSRTWDSNSAAVNHGRHDAGTSSWQVGTV